jgi:Zn-dependent metalloprotease
MLGGAVTALGLVTGSLVAIAPATAAPSDPRARAVAKLEQSSDRTPSLTTEDGVVTNVQTAPGHPVDRPAGVRAGASAEAAARGFAKAHGAAFGLRNGDATLRTESTTPAADGLEVVRFRQTVANVPVLGADVVTTVNDAGETVAVNSTVTTATPADTTPRVTAQRAAGTARAATVRNEKLPASADLTVSTPELALFDPAVFGAFGRPGMRPVWQVQVKGMSADGPVAADVLVDARAGQVVLYANSLRAARDRQVCDHRRTPLDEPSTPGLLCPDRMLLNDPVDGGRVEAVEGTVNAGVVADVTNAYQYAGHTYDFFKTLFNRDSIDDKGMQIRSSVRFCPTGTSGPKCFENAYWDGEQMVYGPGYASADDVVAHELTHGITEKTANLFYWYQSGAINESMSDVFGEFVDLTNGTDSGAAANQVAWLLGEDLPTGALRSMSDPESKGDPATMTSARYKGDTGNPATNDGGGVHSNSGVGNHAAYLIAQGLGGDAAAISKAAHIYYQTLLSLPSGADYADLAGALQSSCTTLVGASLPAMAVLAGDPATVSLTTANCGVVQQAITTTKMTQQPTVPRSDALEAPFCPDGSAPQTPALFSDDMEDKSSGRWTHTQPADPWDASTGYFDPALYGLSYARSGKMSLIGFSSGTGKSGTAGTVGRIQSAAAVPIPAGKQTFLWFAHADYLVDGKNDGARVSAAYAEGGTTRTVDVGVPDAGTRPAVNGYGATALARDGRTAFTGDSRGYVSSRFELTRFAGKSVKLNFDILGNTSGDTNWWIDDVRVYTCAGPTPTAPKAASTTPTSATAATVTWTKPEWAGDSGLSHYLVHGVGAARRVDVDPAVSTYTLPLTGLSSTTAYPVTVRAYAVDGSVSAASPVGLVPTTTTLTTSRATAAYPATVTLSGTVTRRDDPSIRLPYATATVQMRYAGYSTWVTAGTVNADGNGVWRLVQRPTRNVVYQVVLPAAPGRWAGASNRPLAQNAAPRVTASFRPTAIGRGQTARMTVSVAPVRVFVVELQRRSGSKWVLVQRRTTNKSGKVTLTTKPGARGKFVYRVVTRASTMNVAGASVSRTLTVR